MKKKLYCIISLILICISLCGCHGSKGMRDFIVPDGFDDSREYEITFWAKNDSNRAQSDIYKNAIASFEEIYPNIHITIKSYTDYTKIYNDVITNISTGTTPNVCITYPDHIATYMTGNNTVIRLDDLLNDPKIGLGGSQVSFDAPKENEIIPEFLEECRFSDGYYAVPYMRSTEALYMNKTYIEELGYEIPETVTWDWVFEVAEAATEKDEGGNYLINGQKVMIPFIYKSTDNMMIQMLRQKGRNISDDAGNIYLFQEETDHILQEIYNHTVSGAFSTFKVSSYPANYLNAGQCIFAIDSTAGATWMGSNAPNLDIAEENVVEFETAVSTIPQFDPEHPQMISQGPSLCIFNKDDPQEVVASWLFVQYLLSNDVQISYAKTEGYVPVTSKAQNSEIYQEYLSRSGENNSAFYPVKIAATRLLLDNTENTFTTSVFNGSTSLRNAAGQIIESAVNAARRKETLDLNSIYDNVISLYRLDQLGSDTLNRDDLGPLPATSVILLASLGTIWFLIGIYVLIHRKKQ